MKTTLQIAKWIGIVSLAFGAFGCSTVPPESVELSKSLGKGLSNSRDAHVATLTSFYEARKESNDQWILDTFMPRSIQNVKKRFVDACKRKGDATPECSQISERDFETILKQVMGFRDELQRALEKNRLESVSLIDSHYASLNNGNSAITGLLLSVVDLKKSTKDAASGVASSLGINLDVYKIGKSFDDFLMKAGDGGSKVQDLEKALEKVFEKK